MSVRRQRVDEALHEQQVDHRRLVHDHEAFGERVAGVVQRGAAGTKAEEAVERPRGGELGAQREVGRRRVDEAAERGLDRSAQPVRRLPGRGSEGDIEGLGQARAARRANQGHHDRRLARAGSTANRAQPVAQRRADRLPLPRVQTEARRVARHLLHGLDRALDGSGLQAGGRQPGPEPLGQPHLDRVHPLRSEEAAFAHQRPARPRRADQRAQRVVRRRVPEPGESVGDGRRDREAELLHGGRPGAVEVDARGPCGEGGPHPREDRGDGRPLVGREPRQRPRELPAEVHVAVSEAGAGLHRRRLGGELRIGREARCTPGRAVGRPVGHRDSSRRRSRIGPKRASTSASASPSVGGGTRPGSRIGP